MGVAKETVLEHSHVLRLQRWETAGSSVELVVACSLVSRRGVDGGQHGNHFGTTPANSHSGDHFYNPGAHHIYIK